jgi:hypothetical protein
LSSAGRFGPDPLAPRNDGDYLIAAHTFRQGKTPTGNPAARRD